MQLSANLKSLQPSCIRQIFCASTAPGVISLAGGLPASDSFPMSLMMNSIAALASQPELFQYGQTEGYPPLLEAVQQRYHIEPRLASIICTGLQQALDLVARAILDPGDHVIPESPVYLGALQVFALAEATEQVQCDACCRETDQQKGSDCAWRCVLSWRPNIDGGCVPSS